jgi:uncharacterized protein (TIGR02284 family)
LQFFGGKTKEAAMAKDMTKLIGKLNDLIALDLDAVTAYGAAIERIDSAHVRESLRQFQQDHVRHVHDLTACVRSYGGEPRERRDVKGVFIQAFTAVSSMMGDHSALRAMHSNEEMTNQTYETALEIDWPEQVRLLLERNREDERTHLEIVEQFLRESDIENQVSPTP